VVGASLTVTVTLFDGVEKPVTPSAPTPLAVAVSVTGEFCSVMFAVKVQLKVLPRAIVAGSLHDAGVAVPSKPGIPVGQVVWPVTVAMVPYALSQIWLRVTLPKLDLLFVTATV
jgi:hypothetical protein